VLDVDPVGLHEVKAVCLGAEVIRARDVVVARVEERQVVRGPLERRLVHLAAAAAVQVRTRPALDEVASVVLRSQRDELGRGVRQDEHGESHGLDDGRPL
jgi:hypothetical protein